MVDIDVTILNGGYQLTYNWGGTTLYDHFGSRYKILAQGSRAQANRAGHPSPAPFTHNPLR